MHALLIIAHGSRRKQSNEEIIQLAQKVAQRKPDYDHVSAAFLELAEPDIETACAKLIKNGYQKITCLPYFLAAGNHIKNDIPGIVDNLRAAYPDNEIVVLDYIGAQPKMIDLIVNHI